MAVGLTVLKIGTGQRSGGSGRMDRCNMQRSVAYSTGTKY